MRLSLDYCIFVFKPRVVTKSYERLSMNNFQLAKYELSVVVERAGFFRPVSGSGLGILARSGSGFTTSKTSPIGLKY